MIFSCHLVCRWKLDFTDGSNFVLLMEKDKILKLFFLIQTFNFSAVIKKYRIIYVYIGNHVVSYTSLIIMVVTRLFVIVMSIYI